MMKRMHKGKGGREGRASDWGNVEVWSGGGLLQGEEKGGVSVL